MSGQSTRPGIEFGKLAELHPSDLVVRFAAGAAASLISALVGVFIGVRVAGVFLAFPATLIASLTLLESKEGERPAREFSHGTALGAVALTAFAAVTAISIDDLVPSLALLLALVAWLAVALAAYGLLVLVVR